MKQPTIYNTAIYCRLSKDDGLEQDSSSIQTQKEMLSCYCREHGFIICEYYIDDGYSGKNFDRPDFKRMISDIDARIKKDQLKQKLQPDITVCPTGIYLGMSVANGEVYAAG